MMCEIKGIFLLAAILVCIVTLTARNTLATEINTSKEVDPMEELSSQEGRILLKLARNTIKKALFGKEEKVSETYPEKLTKKRGAFVTLTIKGKLRGCIGHIIPSVPLVESVKENAINAAFKDPRFPPLSKTEFDEIKIEVSVLTEPKKLEYKGYQDLLSKLRPHIDGVIIKKGFHQATFLPQVWEQLPQKEEFLSHLCMKAGLPANEWKKGELEVLTYQVQAFEEE